MRARIVHADRSFEYEDDRSFLSVYSWLRGGFGMSIDSEEEGVNILLTHAAAKDLAIWILDNIERIEEADD